MATALAALALVSCGSPKRQALKELQARGIEASGPLLLEAVRAGDTDLLRLLVTAGTFTDQRDDRGFTPLHVAIEHGAIDDAWLLIDGGADLEAQGPGKVSPLAMAVVCGEAAIADKLLKAGARPEGRTPDGEKLLPWAMRHGRWIFVRRLMEQGADPHIKDSRHNPLLHIAIECGNRPQVHQLIQLGADCGAVNGEGESAVVLAIRRGWTDLLPELAAGGADVNRADRDGVTPLVRAYRAGQTELFELLRRCGARPVPGDGSRKLAEAYHARDFDLCGMLVRFGIRPSDSLMHQAAEDGQANYLHLFLCYREAPPRLLRACCTRGRTHLASLLIAHGAKVNEPGTPFPGSAFTSALESGCDDLAARLLDLGADPDQRTAYGVSPLHLALARGNASTVKRLIHHGADVTTPLPSPVPRRFSKLVRGDTLRWLLRNDSRIAPIMLAVDSGSIETTRAMINAGAERFVWTRRSRIWPINIASGHGDIPMMRLLLEKDPYKEERRVLIDLSEQQLWVYDMQGSEIFKTRVSTGRSGYRTRTGTFAITNRYRSWNSTIYHSSMPYFQRLSCTDFGFHEGYVPGYPASHGCIRVPSGNARRLFGITDVGDRVDIVP
ncbi:ankyrin repeat domain-containing protein [Haloferula sargassicola]|uniref:L,D-TPase catalytic domain-containing protein n=1 Tax=Haloferula sargassicola TaxID=490096 RepID=A0ABP9UP72_9BACT